MDITLLLQKSKAPPTDRPGLLNQPRTLLEDRFYRIVSLDFMRLLIDLPHRFRSGLRAPFPPEDG